MGADLAARTAAAVERQTDPAAGSLQDHIRAMQAQFALAMPRGAEAAQLVRDAITAVRTTKNLAQCDSASVLGALMTCAQLGLRPGVLGHGWVLPYWSSKDKTYHAQFVIGYQGLIELAHRTGHVASLIAREVHQHDHLDVDYGLADSLVHKPLLTGDRGPVIGYYAIVKYTTGGHSFIYASREDVEKHRDKFASAKTREGKIFGPWVDHFDSMALKSVVRELSKWMPKSTEFAAAISADEGVRVDLSPNADIAAASQPTWVDAVDEDLAGATAEDTPDA